MRVSVISSSEQISAGQPAFTGHDTKKGDIWDGAVRAISAPLRGLTAAFRVERDALVRKPRPEPRSKAWPT